MDEFSTLLHHHNLMICTIEFWMNLVHYHNLMICTIQFWMKLNMLVSDPKLDDSISILFFQTGCNKGLNENVANTLSFTIILDESKQIIQNLVLSF